jgi:hypothetical protein
MGRDEDNVNDTSPDDVYVGRILFQPFGNSAPALNTTTATLLSVNENVTAAADAGQSLSSFVAELTGGGITDFDNPTYQADTHTITATYNGSGNYNGSLATPSQSILASRPAGCAS